jgi:phosphatidylglycerophosphate synthase
VIRQAALYLAAADDTAAAHVPVAGRPAVFRVIVSAVRAGVRRVGVPSALRTPALDALVASSPQARDALVWLDGPGGLAAEPTLLVPATALTPPPALAALLEAPPLRLLAESQPSGAPVVTVDAALLALLGPGLAAGEPLGDVLTRELKARDVTSARSGRWLVQVTGARAAADAETRLWRELGSAIDSRLDTALHRRLSKPLTRAALALGIGPNPITISSGLVGLVAAAAFADGSVPSVVAGLVIYFVAVVLDHADGEVARLTLRESLVGEWLDIGLDTLVHTTLALALGLAASRVTGEGMVAGCAAAVGVVASAVVGKRWPPMTAPSASARGVLDALTSRDGFYAMLVLFIVLRIAAPPLLPALMAVVAVGTHAYWLARAALWLRRGREDGTRP